MSGAFGTYRGSQETHAEFQWGNLKEGAQFGDLEMGKY